MPTDLIEDVDCFSTAEHRHSRSNAFETLLRRGLDGNGLTHSRISELATAYLLGYVGADEAMREIARWYWPRLSLTGGN